MCVFLAVDWASKLYPKLNYQAGQNSDKQRNYIARESSLSAAVIVSRWTRKHFFPRVHQSIWSDDCGIRKFSSRCIFIIEQQSERN